MDAKCFAFHFNHLDVCTVSILSQLSHESSRQRTARISMLGFKDWIVSRNYSADPRSYNIQSQYAILKA